MIRAVTFDFWDTIVADDSDEPRRKAAGMPPKSEARLALFSNEVLSYHPYLDHAAVLAAHQAATDWFNIQWKRHHKTPCVADRLLVGFDALNIKKTAGFDQMVNGYETMEVGTPPDLAPGIESALMSLSVDYKIGIISDAIVTPGWGLRDILSAYGLLHYFSHFVFSDEAGASKPNPTVFDLAARGLGVNVSELAHVGDREANDIKGPLGVGAVAVLYTGTIDRGSDTTEAQIHCAHHDQLPSLIQRYGARP